MFFYIVSRDLLYIINNRYHKYYNLVSFEDFYKEYLEYAKQNTLKNISSELYTKLLTESFKSVFEDVDIISREDCIFLITHIPSITITNTVGQAHEMKDIYLRFTFNVADKTLHYVEMARSTLTLEEIHSNYVFSHLNSYGSPGSWSSRFCFGDATPLSILDRQFRNRTCINFTEYFLLFREYLNWESLEGIPHRHMDKIKLRNSNEARVRSYQYRCYLDDYKTKLYSILPELNYEIIPTTQELRIKFNSQSIEKIDEALTGINSEFDFIRENDIAVTNNSETKDYSNAMTEIIYKGVEIPLTVIMPETKTTIDKKLIHPEIRNIVVSEVEQKLSTFITNKKFEQLCQQ